MENETRLKSTRSWLILNVRHSTVRWSEDDAWEHWHGQRRSQSRTQKERNKCKHGHTGFYWIANNLYSKRKRVQEAGNTIGENTYKYYTGDKEYPEDTGNWTSQQQRRRRPGEKGAEKVPRKENVCTLLVGMWINGTAMQNGVELLKKLKTAAVWLINPTIASCNLVLCPQPGGQSLMGNTEVKPVHVNARTQQAEDCCSRGDL